MESIAKTLGTGSGIDIKQLVDTLVEAQFAAKTARITRREETLTAQLSSVAQLKNAITGFSTALSQLVTGGTLGGKATSSNTGIVNAAALPGASLANVDRTIEVRSLAAAQSAYTSAIADPAAAVGEGTLTITLGTATVANGAMTGFTPGSAAAVNVTIDSTNSSLTGIRDAINAANAGVTASIVTDSNGARLVMKGATGEAKAFTMSVTESVDAPGLSVLAVGVGASGTTIGSTAADALVAVDGVPVRRTSNSVTDLIPGIRLDLAAASPGTIVRIGATPQTDNLRQAVNDVVATYNEVQTLIREATDPITGPLRNDPGARAMATSLRNLTLSNLIPADGAAPRTLAELGVSTARDGTLSVNAATLTRVLNTYPDAVGRMFSAGNGLSGALFSIANAATNRATGLGASEQRYTRQQSQLTDEKTRAATEAENARERMTRQFAGMDARVAAYRSTQTFLSQQIDAWNAQG